MKIIKSERFSKWYLKLDITQKKFFRSTSRANRFSDWQADLSAQLVNSQKRRKVYFEALRNEYENDLEVLRVIVKVMGLKEFSSLCGLPSSNISNYLKKGKDLKISTLKKLLSPFGLKVVTIPIDLAA